MQSYLIVGGKKEERLKKAQQMANSEWRIASLDRIILKAGNSIGIDQIRHLQRQLSLKPYSSSSKIAIIPEAEKLTVPAQNAMLKLTEEPPRNTIIILCSPIAEVLLPTIVSRCQLIRLPSRPQIETNKEIINHQSSIINHISNSSVGERIKIADEIGENRQEAIKFCQAQLVIWRKRILKASTVKTIRKIQKTLELLEANVNPKLALENLLLQYPSSDDPGSSQIGRTGKTIQE